MHKNQNEAELSLLKRFHKFYKKVESGCWVWISAKSQYNYGYITYSYKNKVKHIRAHRYSYEVHKGEIPEGLIICHSCDNRLCVNPDHLFIGTQEDNMRDMIKKKRQNISKGKLTESDVLDIKKKLLDGYSLNKLAKMYNSTKGNISFIKRNKAWKHVVIR